jgi:hypothetical protein
MTMAASPAPADAQATAAVISHADELARLLERETALVRALKIAEIAPLQHDKTRLTLLIYKALKQSPPVPSNKSWLAAGRRLAQAAIDNERALRVGRAATERLIATVITAVKQSRRPLTSYAPCRGVPREPMIAGVSLDRRL